jgi:Xaa-Pro dipeptidase
VTIIERAQAALRADGCDGWLLYNIYHRDHLADRLLGVSPKATNTRPWACWVPAAGPARALVHGIESDILGHAPVAASLYTSREQLHAGIREWLRRQSRYAMNFSAIPPLSLVDHATVATLSRLAPEAQPVSAETVVQRTLGLLDSAGVRSHQAAARHLYEIVAVAWEQLHASLVAGRGASEGDVQQWILEQIAARGLVTEHEPIVAVGNNTADAHYQPLDGGAQIDLEQVLQLDLWAKSPGASGIYADISWVGFTGTAVPRPLERAFAAVVAARDAVGSAASAALAAGSRPRGDELDRQARASLQGDGLLPNLRHRTGHALDILLHGIGVNLDAVEFPDARRLLDGSCFSVEPGVYDIPADGSLGDTAAFGVRTEINAYIEESRYVISGGPPQTAVLRF